MSISIPGLRGLEIVYPDSDGEPMAENTLQFQWIVTIKEGLDERFRDRPDVSSRATCSGTRSREGPKIRQAPDAHGRHSAGRRDTAVPTGNGRKAASPLRSSSRSSPGEPAVPR